MSEATPQATERCPACGQKALESALYCIDCGTRLLPGSGSAEINDPGTHQVWRPIAVLFVSLTSTGERVAIRSDGWHQLASSLLEQAEAVARRHGGNVDRFSLRQVKLVFVCTDGRMNPAGAAARAGLELANRLRDWLRRLPETQAEETSFRIALHAGDALIDPRRTAGAPEGHGLPAAVAARILRQTPAGSVWLSQDVVKRADADLRTRTIGEVELRGVRDRVLLHELIDIVPASINQHPARGSESKLVGREVELAWLEKSAERVRNGEAVRILIEGEPGVGKTRLISELMSRLEQRGMATFLARSTPQLRFEPFTAIRLFLESQLLKEDSDAGTIPTEDRLAARIEESIESFALDGPALRSLFATVLPGESGLGIPPERQAAVLDKLVRIVMETTIAGRPLALFGDDVQYLDPGSNAFTAAGVAAENATALLLVLTVRRGEALPWMTPEFGFERIVLAPLSHTESRTLVEQTLATEQDSPEPLIESIVRRAGGNPLFIEELSRQVLSAGQSPVPETLGSALPTTLRATVSARIDRLREHLPRVVRVAGVIGPCFSSRMLRRVLGTEAVDIEPWLEELQHEGLLRPTTGTEPGDLAFRHPVLAEVAAAELPARERSAIEARIATLLVEGDSSETMAQPAHVAARFEAAGDIAAALRWHARAARLAASNPAVALDHLNQILALARQYPTELHSMREGLAASLDLLRLCWTHGIGESEIATAGLDGRSWARALGDRTSEALLLDLHGSLSSFLGPISTALALSAEGRSIAAATGHRPLETALQARCGFVLYYAGELREALACVDSAATDLGRDLLGFSPNLYLRMLSGICEMEFGRLDAARDILQQVAEASRAAGDGVVETWVLACAGPLAHACGAQVEEAVALSRTSLEQMRNLAGPLAIASAGFSLGVALLAARRFEEASEIFGSALTTTRSRSHAWLIEAPICAGLARSLTGSGRFDQAIESARYAVTFTGLRGTRLLELDALAALAEALIAHGSPEATGEAKVRLQDVAALIEHTGAERFRPVLHRTSARLARRLGDSPRARQEAELAADLFARQGAGALAEEMKRLATR